LQHHGAAHRQAELQAGIAPGVEDRRGDHHPVAGVQRDPGDDRGERGEAMGGRPSGALRGAGGAGGEHDGTTLAGRLRQRLGVRLPDQVAELTLVDAGDLPGQPGDLLVELVVVHDRAQSLLLRDGEQLRAGDAGVHQYRVDAQHAAGDHRLDHAAVVAAHHPDPGTRDRVHPTRRAISAGDRGGACGGAQGEGGAQRARQPLGAAQQLGVGTYAGLVDDGRPAGMSGGR
jgi:hypothetical protein